MQEIQKITSDPYQKQTLLLDDGTSMTFTLRFVPMQLGWFISELIWQNSFILRGMRVCNNPNMLLQWQNLLPFGLGCFSDQNREPQLVEDFSSGASRLYILTAAECAEWLVFLNDG